MTDTNSIIRAMGTLPMTAVEHPPETLTDGLPYTTHEGKIDLGGGRSIRIYQLSTGERVFDAGDVNAFFSGISPTP